MKSENYYADAIVSFLFTLGAISWGLLLGILLRKIL